jgi:hypothetical protein
MAAALSAWAILLRLRESRAPATPATRKHAQALPVHPISWWTDEPVRWPDATSTAISTSASVRKPTPPQQYVIARRVSSMMARE